MKTTKRCIQNVLGAFSLAAILLAAGPATAQSGAAVGKEEWVPVKRLSFDVEDVQGGTLSPDGIRVESVSGASQASLIELRTGFEAEIVKTMEDL